MQNIVKKIIKDVKEISKHYKIMHLKKLGKAIKKRETFVVCIHQTIHTT